MLTPQRLKFGLFTGGALALSLLAIGCTQQTPSVESPVASSAPVAALKAVTSTVTIAADATFPRYQHIFVIVAENKGYDQIMGNPNAPNINQLAKTYGLASQFYGIVHPSEANYIVMLGGSTFGIHDDDAYYCQRGSTDPFCSHAKAPDYVSHTVTSKSLMDQLQQKGLTWKGYFEDIPAPGSNAVVYPSVLRALYAVKHNGFMSFQRVQDDADRARKLVGLAQLTQDLETNRAPNYSHIIFNQCHEMHGLAECNNLQSLIKTGDAMIGKAVAQITHAKLWASTDNVAIIVTWDEDNNPEHKIGTQGCCGFVPTSAANFGGGHIPTVVITNHGPRGVVDSTPYNHYSLLRTTEDAFGIGEYLNEAGRTDKGVKPMRPLFAVQKQ